MATTSNRLTDLYREALESVTATPENWLRFLQSAGRNYRYPFQDQLLIYHQRRHSAVLHGNVAESLSVDVVHQQGIGERDGVGEWGGGWVAVVAVCSRIFGNVVQNFSSFLTDSYRCIFPTGLVIATSFVVAHAVRLCIQRYVFSVEN